MRIQILLCVSVLSLFLRSSFAQTTVGGIISSNTTWTISGSPYIVAEDLFVDTGITLTIKAGVIIKFDHNKSLEVDGTIRAIGKSDSVILFTADTLNASEPFWSGIYIRDEAEPFNFNNQSGCKLDYCTFEYSGTENFYEDPGGGLFTIYSKVSVGIDHCILQYGYCGLSASSGSYISNCVIQKNISDDLSGPIIKTGTNSQVFQNIFYQNVVACSDGMVSASKNIKIFNNVFAGNEFVLFTAITISDSCRFYGNTFVDNTEAIINLENGLCYNNTITRNQENAATVTISNFTPNFYNNNILRNYSDVPGGNDDEFLAISQGSSAETAAIENNWWGLADSALIALKIHDHNDASNLCTLDFVPYLNSPDTTAPVIPPFEVFKKELTGGNVEIYWNKNGETDLAGYKVYYNGFTGYSFSNSQIVNADTSVVISGVNINDVFGVTAYDINADGTIDQMEGHESWFTYATPDSSVGIGNPQADLHYFQIYPNPCSGFFFIQSPQLSLPSTEIIIYDAFGRKVKTIDPQHDGLLTISVADLESGIYEVELLIHGKSIDHSKLIIQNSN